MIEAFTGTIVPAFTSLSILCMKMRYEDTCATTIVARREAIIFAISS